MINSFIARVTFALLALVILTEAVSFLWPLPASPAVTLPPPTVTTTGAAMPWPATGQAAVGGRGFGLLDSHGSQTPAPIASVAKVITALAVLQKEPLTVSQPGPTITLGPADVASYSQYLAQDGSVVLVGNGEQLSERQALEAMLLPSADNMADSLATWAFGSQAAYLSFANQFVKTLGMNQTTLADASGFSPGTISTATDLVRLGLAAMDSPVLAQIVSEKTASIPVAGTIYNLNRLLGVGGIVGIKTGNTDQAGGCFLFASLVNVGPQPVTLVGAVMNAPTLNAAIDSGQALATAAASNFELVSAVHSGQSVGSYSLPWGGKVQAVAQKDIKVAVWMGQKVAAKVQLNNLRPPDPAGQKVGLISVSYAGQVANSPATLAKPVQKPPLHWRLLRL